jgi:hypothetical protein
MSTTTTLPLETVPLRHHPELGLQVLLEEVLNAIVRSSDKLKGTRNELLAMCFALKCPSISLARAMPNFDYWLTFGNTG